MIFNRDQDLRSKTQTKVQWKLYQEFKKQLLEMMSQMHPLDILESGVFEKYEAVVFEDKSEMVN